MKRIIIVLISLMTHSAFAEVNYKEGYYVGGAIGTTHHDFKGTAVELLGGYKHNSFVGGELRIGTVESDLNYVSALYRVESANSASKTYLLAGYTRHDIASDLGGGDISGATFGAGVGVVIFDTLNLNLEYRAFDDNSSDFEMPTVTLGVDYRF